jgi:DNA repair protein RecN (Recombination protein N)
MLVELVIRDLALIEEARLSFGPGLNAITGETGAGKTLVVGALELLLGERAKPGRVRSGAARASVEARFAVPSGPAGAAVARWARRHMPQLLEEWRELEREDERELVVARTISADGRTRAWVNGRPIQRIALVDLAPRLFEIHGQHGHQRLFDAGEQLRLLDAFGGLEPKVKRYRDARETWRSLVDEAARLQREQEARRDRLDLARFQLGEIAAAAPDPEERARLAPERELLRNAAGLKDGLANLSNEISESDDALLDRLRRAERFVAMWKTQVGDLAPAHEALEAAALHLDEAARSLASLAERLEIDPARLEAVEDRLAELERLERKYKTDVSGLIARRRELEAEIARLETDEHSLEGLAEKVAAARADLVALGGELRRSRKALRSKLAKAVVATFGELGLADARFDVVLGQRVGEDESVPGPSLDPAALAADAARFGERGLDRIEFTLSANPGEPLQKLRHVASGGETARIMLALRSVLAAAGGGRTLVFDEIDSGVGGRLGPVVGAHLKKLAEHHQVLCVTHLPAIAAAAHAHLRVSKVVEGDRARTRVEELAGDAREREIADMIAGGAGEATARAEARRLLGAG